MALNFDMLPDTAPGGSVIPEGTYYATIDNIEMKAAKDVSKPDYLNVTYQIKTKEGKILGKVFDIFTESESDIARYKLKRFILALELPITGTFELKDLTKICKNKTLIVDLKVEEKEGYAPKTIVDVFKNNIFYSVNEAATIFGTDGIAVAASENVINASDAEDSAPESY